MTQPALSELVDYDEDELFELLGAAVMGRGLGFAEEDPERSREFGKKWFGSRLPDIRARICGHDSMKRLTSAADSKGAEDAAAVADLLLGLWDQPTVACVSVIVMRRGLKAICDDKSS